MILISRWVGALVSLAMLTLPAGGSGGLEGTWEGALEGSMGLTPVVLEFERTDAGWSGTFAFPSENVRDMPMAGVEVQDDSVLVTFAARRTFHGRHDGDWLTGVARFDDRAMPASFARAGTAAAADVAARIAESIEATRPAPLEAVATGPGADRVDPDALDELIRTAQVANSHALVVLHDGELVGAWHAGGERRRIEAMSATKSIVSLAIGRLVTTGALESIDVPVHTFYPEWATGSKSRVTIRHLLDHTSGIEAGRTTEAIYASDDFVRHALDSDLTTEPGTETFYNNSATNLLAGIAGVAAGQRMDLFLRKDLFARLGIHDFSWSLDPAGNPHGMAGLQIYADDLARLGQLVLQRGEWEGEQLIDDAWFDDSMSPRPGGHPDVGLLWWLIREDGDEAARVVGYRADGYLGQYLVVYPDQRLVGVRMVAPSPAYDPATDGFRDFQTRLHNLTP